MTKGYLAEGAKTVAANRRADSQADADWFRQEAQNAKDQADHAKMTGQPEMVAHHTQVAKKHLSTANAHQQDAIRHAESAFRHADKAKGHFTEAGENFSAYAIPQRFICCACETNHCEVRRGWPNRVIQVTWSHLTIWDIKQERRIRKQERTLTGSIIGRCCILLKYALFRVDWFLVP